MARRFQKLSLSSMIFGTPQGSKRETYFYLPFSTLSFLGPSFYVVSMTECRSSPFDQVSASTWSERERRIGFGNSTSNAVDFSYGGSPLYNVIFWSWKDLKFPIRAFRAWTWSHAILYLVLGHRLKLYASEKHRVLQLRFPALCTKHCLWICCDSGPHNVV